MKRQSIFITGDDGYNSIGTRLLIRFLKDKYDLTVCATKNQQSGIGGKSSLNERIHWHETKVDGVRVTWVDGTPIDAVEFAEAYFNRKFDYAISGINMGANISGTVMSSGTFIAATRIIHMQMSQRVLSISWHLPVYQWFKNHSEKDDISSFIKYPGEAAYKIIELAIINNFWDSKLLNINLPEHQGSKIIFTYPQNDKRKFYKPVIVDKKTNTFTYSKKLQKTSNPIETDIGAVQNGYVSITPCKNDMLNEKTYAKLKKLKLNIW